MENRKNIRERDLLVEDPAHLAFVRKISCYYYRFVPVEKRGLVIAIITTAFLIALYVRGAILYFGQ